MDNKTFIECVTLKSPSNEKIVDVLLVPDGEVTTSKKNFTLREEDYEAIVSKFNTRKVDLVIDYEHQTLGGEHSSPNGTAPAAGWVHELRYEKGRGIIGRVQWTKRARELILSGEYRYLSPVLMVSTEKSGNYPYELLHAAVTNDPAIHGMERLAASNKGTITMPKKGKKKNADKFDFLADGKARWAFMEATPEEQAAVVEDVVEQVDEVGSALANLKAALGMGEGATPVEIINEAISMLSADPEAEDGEGETEEAAASRKALDSIRTALALTSKATPEAIVKKVDTMIVGTVSAEAYTKMTDRVEVLESKERKTNAQALVEKFVASRQLNPNDEAKMKWAFDRAEKDASAFTELMEGAPAVVPAEGSMGDANESGGKQEREKLVASAGSSYDKVRGQFPGLTRASFVNQALRDDGLDTLNESETEKIGKESN